MILELDSYSKRKGLFDKDKCSTFPEKKKNKKISDEEDIIESLKDKLKSASYDSTSWRQAFPELRIHYRFIYTKALKSISSCLGAYLKAPARNSHFRDNLKSIQKTFKLNNKECEIITFLYLLQHDSDVEFLFRISLDMNEIVKSIRLYCRFFQISPTTLKELISKNSRLVRSGIIVKGHNSNELSISSTAASYLAGSSHLNILDSLMRNTDCSSALSLSEHNVPPEKIASVLNLIKSKRGTNILLYGKPGTGKTEFVKSLGSALNKKVYFINQKNEDGEEDLAHRKTGIIAAMNMLDLNKSIIVVDECDSIININDGFWRCEKENDSKAWINDIIENSNQNVVWISNRVDGVDESTKRRFSYSIEFLNLSHKQRVKVWENQIASASITFIDRKQIDVFAKQYQVNAGGIALALKDVSSMKNLKTKEEKVRVLESLLAQHQSFVFGHSPLNPLAKTYSLEALNSDVDLHSVVTAFKRFIDYSAKSDNKEISNMNLLLQGPPGTGKTEFVKYLAQTIGKEILVKRMSDLMSKYVGETEKLIKGAFKEAARSDSILL